MHYLLELPIEPRSRADGERMATALARMASRDPSFEVSVDRESGQTSLKGIDENHLEIIVDRLKHEFKIEVSIGVLQIAYRETISHKHDADYTHKELTRGSGQYARVKIIFEPLARGSGVEFVDDVKGGSLPHEFIPAVERGIRAAMNSGPLIGYPAVDFKATLYDGAYHQVDSSELTFEIAARAAFREGMAKAGPKLLEPMMRVDIVAPEDCIDLVIADLQSRRGYMMRVSSHGNTQVIEAQVPLANMFGYVNTLRSMTRGRAQYTMVFDHYEEVPPKHDPPFGPAVGMRA